MLHVGHNVTHATNTVRPRVTHVPTIRPIRPLARRTGPASHTFRIVGRFDPSRSPCGPASHTFRRRYDRSDPTSRQPSQRTRAPGNQPASPAAVAAAATPATREPYHQPDSSQTSHERRETRMGVSFLAWARGGRSARTRTRTPSVCARRRATGRARACVLKKECRGMEQKGGESTKTIRPSIARPRGPSPFSSLHLSPPLREQGRRASSTTSEERGNGEER